jgi:hypothetical protein
MPLSQDFCPPAVQEIRPPSQKRAIFLGIPLPGDEYPRDIGECPRNITPSPFRIFTPHICDVVYSNNFVILSSY